MCSANKLLINKTNAKKSCDMYYLIENAIVI